MAKHLQILTNSELNTHRLCPARWGFAYVELLRPLVMARPLQWGDLYHCGAEAGWEAAWSVPEASVGQRLALALGAAPVAIAERAAEHIREIEGLEGVENKDQLCEETEQAAKVASWSVAHYFSCARSDLAMVPLMIEGTFQVQIPTVRGVGGRLATSGVVDLLLWDREAGRLVVQDHKGIGGDVHGVQKRVELDTQLVGYVCAVGALVRSVKVPADVERLFKTTPAAALLAASQWPEVQRATIGCVAYNVVRRRMPAEPSVNLLKKNQIVTAEQRQLFEQQEQDGEGRGEVSVAAIDTLPQIYQQALERQVVERLLPVTDKQLARMQQLRERGDTFFTQIEYFKSTDAIERWRRELWVEAKRIRAAERDPALRTRNHQACTLPASPACPYATICLMPDDPNVRRGYRQALTKHEELIDGRNSDEAAAEQPEEEWR